GVPLLLAGVIQALRLRSLAGWLGTGARSWVDFGAVGWAVAAFVSTALSTSPRLSLYGELQHREGLLTALGLVGLYAAARRSHQDSDQARVTIHVFLAAAGLAAGYALLQLTGRDPLAWANTARYGAGGDTVLRPFATLGNPILLGAVL